MKKKTLQELTLKDNFMFGAVMSDEENCRQLLERVLGFPIAKVEVQKEKSMVYHPEFKGIRLDIYAKDENNTHFNVEMQTTKEKNIGKRSRYYHSQIDMELLLAGKPYGELPDTYVIFICDFDPFGEGKYCYTFQDACDEITDMKLGDGSITIFLSTKGTNPNDISSDLLKFLKFVDAELPECMKDFEDDFVRQLQDTMQHIKVSREMEAHYMFMELWWVDAKSEAREEGLKEGREEGLKEGREQGLQEGREQGLQEGREQGLQEGREEGLKEGHEQGLQEGHQEGHRQGRAEILLEMLQERGPVSEELRKKIQSETDLEVLKKWSRIVVKTQTVEEFLDVINR